MSNMVFITENDSSCLSELYHNLTQGDTPKTLQKLSTYNTSFIIELYTRLLGLQYQPIIINVLYSVFLQPGVWSNFTRCSLDVMRANINALATKWQHNSTLLNEVNKLLEINEDIGEYGQFLLAIVNESWLGSSLFKCFSSSYWHTDSLLQDYDLDRKKEYAGSMIDTAMQWVLKKLEYKDMTITLPERENLSICNMINSEHEYSLNELLQLQRFYHINGDMPGMIIQLRDYLKALRHGGIRHEITTDTHTTKIILYKCSTTERISRQYEQAIRTLLDGNYELIYYYAHIMKISIMEKLSIEFNKIITFTSCAFDRDIQVTSWFSNTIEVKVDIINFSIINSLAEYMVCSTSISDKFKKNMFMTIAGKTHISGDGGQCGRRKVKWLTQDN